MKEKLIAELITERGNRAYALSMYNSSSFFYGKWQAEIERADARIKELVYQLSLL